MRSKSKFWSLNFGNLNRKSKLWTQHKGFVQGTYCFALMLSKVHVIFSFGFRLWSQHGKAITVFLVLLCCRKFFVYFSYLWMFYFCLPFQIYRYSHKAPTFSFTSCLMNTVHFLCLDFEVLHFLFATYQLRQLLPYSCKLKSVARWPSPPRFVMHHKHFIAFCFVSDWFLHWFWIVSWSLPH